MSGRVSVAKLSSPISHLARQKAPAPEHNQAFRARQQTKLTNPNRTPRDLSPLFPLSVISVSREATEIARRILALREDHRTMVTAQLGRAAANAHRVLEHLYQRPILGVADVRQLTGTTYTAANNLVSRLSDLGIIQETTSNRRNRLFRYKPYIRIFHESPPRRRRQ